MHLAVARQYVELTDNAGIYETALIETAVETMRTIVAQNPEIVEEVDTAITETLDFYKGKKGDLLDQFARVYALNLTMEDLEQIVAFLLDEGKLGGFHFNNRKYADDDLIVGSVNPYELFLIYHELVSAEQSEENRVRTTAEKLAYMIDQSHNVEGKMASMILSVLNCQEAYAKAQGMWRDSNTPDPVFTDSLELDDDSAAVLMTLHSAKGLEFSDVFIVGLEEGILPHARSLTGEGSDEIGDPLAEERRLLYVGITRAMHRLGLSYCTSRRRGGSAAATLPSRYLEEIPPELIEMRDTAPAISPEESTSLRANFFSSMKEMLAE